MTYFNGNPYLDTITEWAHDDCLPENQIETIHLHSAILGDYTHRQQKPPWHWDRVWGKPEPCKYCGNNVK